MGKQSKLRKARKNRELGLQSIKRIMQDMYHDSMYVNEHGEIVVRYVNKSEQDSVLI